ncbi:Polysaccharide biosynthesis protein [uncultured archaeon]|nr:Polysaccharide biosynthesis protein [uncultured archaeon]
MDNISNSSEIKGQIIQNSFWNVTGSIINRVGGFILIILLSRILMPEGFGRYSIAMTISLFFITFSDMGINQTLIRYVSLGINKKNSKSSAYFKYLFKIKFIVTILLSGFLILVSYPLSVYIFRDFNLFIPLLIMGFYVFLISLISFLEALFFIGRNIKYVSIKEFVSLIIKTGIVLAIGYIASSDYELIGLFLLFVLLSILVLFFYFYLTKRIYPQLFEDKLNKIDKKEIKKSILSLNVQNISVMIIYQAGIILLGAFLAEKYVGYYNSYLVLVTSISGLFSFSYVFLPIMTNLKKEKFKSFLKKIFRLFFIILLPLSFGLSVLSRYFITTLYGEGYLSAWVSLSILAFLIPCLFGIDLSLSIFSSRNKQKIFSKIMVFSAGLFLVLSFIIIKILLKFSGEAAVIGISGLTLIIWIFCFISSIRLMKKEFNVNILSSWIFKPLFSCIIMSIFLHLFLNYLGHMDLTKGLLVILFGALVYFFLMVLTKGINKEDFFLLKRICKLK